MKFKTDLVILRRYYTHFCLTELSYRDKCGLFAFYLDHIYSPSLFIVKTRSVGHILYMILTPNIYGFTQYIPKRKKKSSEWFENVRISEFTSLVLFIREAKIAKYSRYDQICMPV